MDLIASLDEAFSHAHSVISRVSPEQHDDPTPCSEWKVRDLLEHMVSVVGGIGAAVSGNEPQPFDPDADPAAQFEKAAAATLDAWRSPGAMDKTVNAGAGPMPGQVLAGINLLDTATHTWDLAKATGQPTALPDDVAAAAFEVSQQIVSPELRPGRFADAVSVDSQSATDRLVGFLGRNP